ncbi:HSF-type DNA-binding protein [Nitzschia inconspicua]|uniref:HSF-type DNA-binding protein n=1 Tax=Nitzschia inconspicua TaxID=303405 RepID=A0A9K3Q5T7_9STRA|nr:HSF-type DNA-binding protein [Nitzschia inconspicua]
MSGTGAADRKAKKVPRGEENDNVQEQHHRNSRIDHQQQQISLPEDENGRVPHTLHLPFHCDDNLTVFNAETRQPETKSNEDTDTKKPCAKPLSVDQDTQHSFPLKLMSILENDAVSDVISWLPHCGCPYPIILKGRGFRVHDQQRFENEVCPAYFGQRSKFSSFARKLNRWNFSRVMKGADAGSFYHPSFQRGNRTLCAEITSGFTHSSQSEPINPSVALSIATPGMIRHGLIDGAIQHAMIDHSHTTASIPSIGDEDAALFLGVDPQLLQPTPIHPKLDSRRFSMGQQASQGTVWDTETDYTRQTSIEHKMRSQTNPTIQHFVDQLERSKQVAELQHYQLNPDHNLHIHGTILDNTVAPLEHSVTTTEKEQQNQSFAEQKQDPQRYIRDSSMDQKATTMAPHSPSLDSMLFVTGAPVSTTNSSYSDIFEPLHHQNQIGSLNALNHDLLAVYLQRQHQQNHKSVGEMVQAAESRPPSNPDSQTTHECTDDNE